MRKKSKNKVVEKISLLEHAEEILGNASWEEKLNMYEYLYPQEPERDIHWEIAEQLRHFDMLRDKSEIKGFIKEFGGKKCRG